MTSAKYTELVRPLLGDMNRISVTLEDIQGVGTETGYDVDAALQAIDAAHRLLSRSIALAAGQEFTP